MSKAPSGFWPGQNHDTIQGLRLDASTPVFSGGPIRAPRKRPPKLTIDWDLPEGMVAGKEINVVLVPCDNGCGRKVKRTKYRKNQRNVCFDCKQERIRARSLAIHKAKLQ